MDTRPDIPAAAARALAHERDYDGTRVLRGFGIGFVAVALFWVVVALAACAEVGRSPGLEAGATRAAPEFASRKTDCGDVPLPPPAFDHPAAIPVMIREIPFDRVDRECRAHGIEAPRMAFAFGAHGMSAVALLSQATHGDFETKACSWTFARLGFVILPETGKAGVTEGWRACALRHEIGHINGWPASHPDAHYE